MVNICILSTTWSLRDTVEAHWDDDHDLGNAVTDNIDAAAVLDRGSRRPLRGRQADEAERIAPAAGGGSAS